jgi:hypothetical protein
MIELVRGQTVRCELDGTYTHDRCVTTCFLNGRDIAEALVAQGLARDCPRFSDGRYAVIEAQAAADGATIPGELPPSRLLPAPIDLPRRHPIEAEHLALAGLGVAAVLEVLGAAIEREQLLEQPITNGELDHGAPGRIPADHVAALEQGVQQGARLGVGASGRGITDMG